MNDYERQRAARIAANSLMLSQLGVTTAARQLIAPQVKPARRVKRKMHEFQVGGWGGEGGHPANFQSASWVCATRPPPPPPPLHARTQVEVRRSERVRGQEPTCYAEDAS